MGSDRASNAGRRSGFVVAAGLIAFAGCGGRSFEEPRSDGAAPALDAPASAQDAAGDALAAATVDISGRWAMFAFEDPVAVEITQNGNTLSGTGCYAGLPTPDDPSLPSSFCAGLTGVIEGRHAQFAFASAWAPYAADVFASADGQRMAGRFHDVDAWGSPYAWLRIGPTDRGLPTPAPGGLEDVVQTLSGEYVLSPLGAPPPGVELSASTPNQYVLSVRVLGHAALVLGTLGAFRAGELSWNATEQVLVAGPVPLTSPNLPTEVRLHFDGSSLVDVQATMPSGTAYRFSATALRGA
jgi:hypothetical protein